MEKIEIWKNRLLYFLKAIIGLALVIWILFQVDRQEFIGYFLSLDLSLLLLILPLSFVSLLIQYFRWKYMVSNYSDHFDYKDLLPSFLAGFSFRLMIPGGHAELSKVLLLPGKKRGKVMAFSMERIFQTFIKLILSVWLLMIHFPQYVVIYIIISALVIVAYFYIPKFSIVKSLHEKPVKYNIIFFWSIIFSAGVYAVMVMQYFILLNDAYPISLAATSYTVVYLWSAGIVPISISGLGVREGLAVYFFNLYGVPGAYAVATSLFLFAINAIIPALIGIYYIYQKRDHLKDVKNTMHSSRELWKSLRKNKNAL
jgi:glycosyltransferase 2 family protein